MIFVHATSEEVGMWRAHGPCSHSARRASIVGCGALRANTREVRARGAVGGIWAALGSEGAQPPRRDPLSQLLRGEADALRNLLRSTQAEGRERVERVCVCQAEGRERVERVCA